MQNNALDETLKYSDLFSVHQQNYLGENMLHGDHSLRILAATELYVLFGSYDSYEVSNRNIFNSI